MRYHVYYSYAEKQRSIHHTQAHHITFTICTIMMEITCFEHVTCYAHYTSFMTQSLRGSSLGVLVPHHRLATN
jgi:hypothetical protein